MPLTKGDMRGGEQWKKMGTKDGWPQCPNRRAYMYPLDARDRGLSKGQRKSAERVFFGRDRQRQVVHTRQDRAPSKRDALLPWHTHSRQRQTSGDAFNLARSTSVQSRTYTRFITASRTLRVRLHFLLATHNGCSMHPDRYENIERPKGRHRGRSHGHWRLCLPFKGHRK